MKHREFSSVWGAYNKYMSSPNQKTEKALTFFEVQAQSIVKISPLKHAKTHWHRLTRSPGTCIAGIGTDNVDSIVAPQRDDNGIATAHRHNHLVATSNWNNDLVATSNWNAYIIAATNRDNDQISVANHVAAPNRNNRIATANRNHIATADRDHVAAPNRNRVVAAHRNSVAIVERNLKMWVVRLGAPLKKMRWASKTETFEKKKRVLQFGPSAPHCWTPFPPYCHGCHSKNLPGQGGVYLDRVVGPRQNIYKETICTIQIIKIAT